MKTLTACASALIFLLVSCQIPGPLSSPHGQATAPGTASLNVTLKTKGFSFVPRSAVQGGRFVVAPAPVPGIAHYHFHDTANAANDFDRDDDTGLTGLPPGTWTITVSLYDITGVNVLGTAVLTDFVLQPGSNSISVDVYPTRGGTGSLDVGYSWEGDSVANGVFILTRITLNGTGPYTVSETPIDVASVGAAISFNAGARTAHFSATLNSGTYKLAFQASSATGGLHPPVTATAEIYDSIVSTATVTLAANQLSSPPAPPSSLGYTIVGTAPNLDWDPIPSTAEGFRLYANGAQVGGDLDSSTTSYLDDSTYPPGTTVVYELKAFNDFGEGEPTNSQSFNTVGVVNLSPTGTTNIGVADLVNWGVDIPNATINTYTLVNPNPHLASFVPGRPIRALNLGTATLKVVSDQGGVSSGEVVLNIAAHVMTFAGQTDSVGGSVDGVGTSAVFKNPTALAKGPDGTLYVFDNNGSIPALRSITPDGTVSTITLTAMVPGDVVALAVQSSSLMYFISGNAIYKIAVGAVTLLSGLPTTPGFNTGDFYAVPPVPALYNQPRGLALAGGNLYVSDTVNHVIRQVDLLTGNAPVFAGMVSAGDNMDGVIGTDPIRFFYPAGLAFDGVDRLYVANFGGPTVRCININTLAVTTVAGLVGPNGGTGGGYAIDGDAGVATFSSPEGLAVDGNFLYVADTSNNAIRRVRLPGPENNLALVTTIAGSPGNASSVDGHGGAARMGYVKSLVVEGGTLYVADSDHQTIRKILTSVYGSIYYDDAGFGSLPYDWGNWFLAGDGKTGAIRVGTILLYKTPVGDNHGKLLITGIDKDYGGTGSWRLRLDWTTWNAGGSIVSQGSNLWLTTAGGGVYLDLDAGAVVSTSTDGDLYLANTDDTTRVLNAAANGVSLGVYQY